MWNHKIRPTVFDRDFTYDKFSDDEDDEDAHEDDDIVDAELINDVENFTDDDDCEDNLQDQNILSDIVGDFELKD